MVLAGTDGPIVTPIKALLTPQKMQDLRVKVSSIYSLLPRSRATALIKKDVEKCILIELF